MSANGPAESVDDLAAVDAAIAALEAQRDLLGDGVVETALAPLRERRTALQTREATEQRKLVTVVFADLVDFTVLSRRLDAEDTRDVVGGYFAQWQRVITANGGIVEKFIGDAVMAVFGLYQSWEDDPQRAVRASLAMLAELDTLNRTLGERYGVTLRMRVGIDTGDVVVSTLDERAGHEFVVVGPTVNRASRLQGAAPPDRIMISEDTRRQVRGYFSMEPQPRLRLKGIDEPVDAYLVVSARPEGFQLDRSSGVEGVATTTVGREIELRHLQERIRDVVEDSRWSVVTVVGDAGVGKSRLLLDFDSWLGEWSQPVWWFRGRASHSGQNRANALLHDLMATRLHIADSDAPDAVRAKFADGFERAFGAGEAATRDARLVAVWLGFDRDEGGEGLPSEPQSLRDQATDALARYLARLSGTAPVVVLLEDLHWADDGSLRWLDAADPVLHDARVFVVATTRPALLESRPRWGEGLAHHLRLTLAPLSRRESRQLLGQILQRVAEPPGSLVDLVISASEGNPFYIEELVTWLIDAGVVVRGETTWHVVDELVGSVVVPSSLRGVLQARLDALSQTERGLLQRASVVGRVFWDDAVAHLGRPGGSPATGETLDGLRRREIVFEREVSAFSSSREFGFKHALLRDVAYDGVLRAHRERYHRLAATWLASVSDRSGRQDDYAALIAEHYDRAGDPLAASWYLRGGTQAAGVFALDEAARLLGRGLEVAAEDEPALRFDILAARESVRDRVGDRDGQEGDLTEMERLVEGRDPARRVRLMIARSRWSFALSEYDDAVRWATLGADLARQEGLREQQADAQLWRGKALTWQMDLDAARNGLTDALALAREVGRPALVGESLRYLGMVANNAGDYPTALGLTAQAREVFVEDGDVEAESVALTQYASTCFNMGHVQQAREALEQAQPIFRRSGHLYRESVVLGNLATIAHSQGELAVAERWGAEAEAVARQLNDREALSTNLVIRAMIEVATGRWETAREHLQTAVETSRSMGATSLESTALTQLSLGALENGETGTAREAAERATELAPEVTSPMEPGHASLALAYVELETGSVEHAGAAFTEARTAFSSLELAPLVRECDVGLAVVELARGDADAALGLVRPVLAHLNAEGLESCARPGAVLRGCLQVLDACGDPAASPTREATRSYLLDRARVIDDEALAAGFLALPVHAGLLAPAV